MPTYCGNNRNHISLTSGTHVQGTNHQCLRKGIGVGYHLPYDAAFDPAISPPYDPIDTRRYYCGNANAVPAGYFAMGSASKCMQIGVGVGKSQRGARGSGLVQWRYLVACLTVWAVVAFVLWWMHPDAVNRMDNTTNRRVIDWRKYGMWLVAMGAPTCVVLWFLG
jgi:hypothetical protein